MEKGISVLFFYIEFHDHQNMVVLNMNLIYQMYQICLQFGIRLQLRLFHREGEVRPPLTLFWKLWTLEVREYTSHNFKQKFQMSGYTIWTEKKYENM